MLLAIGAGMVLVRGVPCAPRGGGRVVLAVAVPTFVVPNLRAHQRRRIAGFLNPGADPQGAGYQVIQATIAVGSGGLPGKGYGQGTQGQLGFIPFRQTDFIFPVLAEEGGFVAAVALLALYALLFWRLVAMAVECAAARDQLLIVGVLVFVGFQVVRQRRGHAGPRARHRHHAAAGELRGHVADLDAVGPGDRLRGAPGPLRRLVAAARPVRVRSVGRPWVRGGARLRHRLVERRPGSRTVGGARARRRRSTIGAPSVVLGPHAAVAVRRRRPGPPRAVVPRAPRCSTAPGSCGRSPRSNASSRRRARDRRPGPRGGARRCRPRAGGHVSTLESVVEGAVSGIEARLGAGSRRSTSTSAASRRARRRVRAPVGLAERVVRRPRRARRRTSAEAEDAVLHALRGRDRTVDAGTGERGSRRRPAGPRRRRPPGASASVAA